MFDRLDCRGWLAKLAMAAALGAALATAGCGGSGAGAGGPAPDAEPIDGGTAATGSSPVTLAVYAVGKNEPINAISLSAPGELKATVRDKAGKAVANTVVTFAGSGSSQIAFQPAANALTDSDGVATVIVTPAGISASGAETVTAQASVAGTSVTGSLGLAIGATDVSVTDVKVMLPSGVTAVAPYGTTTVQATVSDTKIPVKVAFTSTCGNSGKATITAQVDTVDGVAAATYTDKGCAATDTVSAQVVGRVSTRTVQFPVQSPSISNIQFISAQPASIALSGTGAEGLQQTSTVTFRVVDQAGNPVTTPQNVKFNLSTSTGGILLDNTADAALPIVKQTGSDGTVQVRVQAGTLPTPVWVLASLPDSPLVSPTQSNRLTISTGRPTQARFSLSATNLNINGLLYDGATSQINIYAADRLGNPVADGTVISFVSEGASVEPSCTTVKGFCSVGFRSQRERPVRIIKTITPLAYIPGSLRSDAGRVTVTAYAVGEESFFDANGNNRFDKGESFEDLGYVYIDPIEGRPLETGIADWTQGRVQVIPFVGALPQGSACNKFMPGSTSIISAPSVPNSCDGSWGSAHVRRDITIVLSGNSPVLATSRNDVPGAMNTTRSLGTTCATTFTFFLQDVNGNPMPAGTTAVVDTSSATDLSATVQGFPVPNTTIRGGTGGSVLVRGKLDTTTTPSTCKGSGTVLFNISAPEPAPLTTTISLTVTP
jgi:hypothetical protein